jgi:hypothetical protein
MKFIDFLLDSVHIFLLISDLKYLLKIQDDTMPEENHVNDFWRQNNFRLEPWGNDYEPPIQIGEEIAQSESTVDETVEIDDWEKFQSFNPLSLPNQLIFIDGRRRLDAALIGGSGKTINYGVFGTTAVGAVLVDRTIPKTSFLESGIEISRVVGFGGNQEAVATNIPCPLGPGSDLIYKPVKSQKQNNPEVRGTIVQKSMLAAEEALVEKLNINDNFNTLVIRDGGMRYESPIFTLGYIKTIHKQYLSEKYASLLWKLLPGERTPIFNIKDRFLYSWYLKSGEPQQSLQYLGYNDLHSIVRLEISTKIPIETVIQIANQTCFLIPYYASHPSRDPRAPQNLAPVSALEKELGRRMGDAKIIKRRIQNFLASFGGSYDN